MACWRCDFQVRGIEGGYFEGRLKSTQPQFDHAEHAYLSAGGPRAPGYGFGRVPVGIGADHLDRAWGKFQNRSRYAAEKESLECADPLGAHHDEIGLERGGLIQDHRSSVAREHHPIRLQASRTEKISTALHQIVCRCGRLFRNERKGPGLVQLDDRKDLNRSARGPGPAGHFL